MFIGLCIAVIAAAFALYKFAVRRALRRDIIENIVMVDIGIHGAASAEDILARNVMLKRERASLREVSVVTRSLAEAGMLRRVDGNLYDIQWLHEEDGK